MYSTVFRDLAESEGAVEVLTQQNISIDQTGKLKKDFRTELAMGDVIGEVEVTSRWPAGYGRMTVVKFPTQ